MELHDLKLLARRLRDVLAPAGATISHGQALDLIAAVPGLRNWPEVSAFPQRVAETSINDDTVERLRKRIESALAIALKHDVLANALGEPQPVRVAQPVPAAKRPVSVRLPTDLHTSDIPYVFDRFRHLVGESHWLTKEKRIQAEIRGAKYLQAHIEQHNDIVLMLARCSDLVKRYGQFPREVLNNRDLFGTFRFAAQMIALMESHPAQAKQLVGRIQGGFKNPDELRAIQFELAMATHFVKRGHAVVLPEMSGGGTFDLLVPDLGKDGLEIECKSVSADKGRKIHRKDALHCFHALRQRLEQPSQNLHSGLSVVVTVPDRLPTEHKTRETLYTAIARAVMQGQSTELADGTEVRISDFDIQRYPALGPTMTPEAHAAVESITGTRNREAMVIGRRSRGALVVVLQSAKEDSFLQSVFQTVDKAARDQLSKTRAGIVVVAFEDITPDELVDTAAQDHHPTEPPTALRIAVSDFLRDTGKTHLVGVGFMSGGAYVEESDGNVSSGGVAYYFPRKESPYWDESCSNLFTPRTT